MSPGIPEGDIDIVVKRTGADRAVAERALERTDCDLAAAIERIEAGEIDTDDAGKSFRERVAEIREERGKETGMSAGEEESPDEEMSFEDRVEEIVKQREQERLEDHRDERTDESAPTHGGGPGDSGARTPAVDSGGGKVVEPEAVASPPRRPGLSQPDLAIGEELGAGGQAVIREAGLPEEKQPPAVVALREPDTSATLTREAAEEFCSRAETWATIDAREREKQRWADYEHVVGIVATGDRQPWLAMEYMDGGDLGDRLAEHPDGLPVAQALWYGECVCRGLEVAHNLGRAHLDVKPGNVLLTETDGWPWPKLADWGLARTLAEETGTMDGMSVAYAAPEQFDADAFGDPDQLTDIYQTGALVYALSTGGPPATGSRFEVMQQVLDEEPITPPSERRPELPAAVDAALGLALERDKTDRYSSISEFATALHAIRTGERLPRDVAARLDT